MAIVVGVFDLFTYTVAGSLYLAFLTYVGLRAGWLDLSTLVRPSELLLFVVGVISSYVLGQASYFVGRALERIVPVGRQDFHSAREEFVARSPAARDRRFVSADRGLLQAAIEVHRQDAALEIVRLRAVGLMLRGSTPVLLLAALASVIELFAGRSAGLAVGCALALSGVAAGSFFQGRQLIRWSNIKTLEIAFWIPGIDEELRASQDATSAMEETHSEEPEQSYKKQL